MKARLIGISLLSLALALVTLGARGLQYPPPSPSTFNPPDQGWLVNWYVIPPGGHYLPSLESPVLFPLPTVAIDRTEGQCPRFEDNVTVRTPIATYHLRQTRHGCVGVPVPSLLRAIYTDINWRSYWGQAVNPGTTQGRAGSDSYIAPFWPVADGITVSAGGGTENPVVVCPRLLGPAGEVPADLYRFMTEGGSDTGIASVHTAHASHREGGCVRYGCDHWRGDDNVLPTVFAPADGAPNFLLVHVGAGEATNQDSIRSVTGLAVYPDCGDNNSPFPPTCIAAHANPTSSPWTTDSFAGNASFGYLGSGVSTELILRPLVYGWGVNGVEKHPTPFAVRFAPGTTPPDPNAGRKWPLPSGLTEFRDRWMSVWHASRWTKLHEDDPRYLGASEILKWTPSLGGHVYVSDFLNQVANHPLALYGFWGKGDIPQRPIISVDVRGIGQRGQDTYDDGLQVQSGGVWVNPETITLTAAMTHTFRVTLQTPTGINANGSVDVWVAYTPTASSSVVFSRVASFVVSQTPGSKTFTFGYAPPLTANNEMFMRVIYRVGLPSPSGNVPTVSGSPPYISAVNCGGGYDCSGPAVEPIAEPFVVSLNHRVPTGEVEDYRIPLRPALVFRGRAYIVTDNSPLSGVAITLTTPSGAVVVTTTNATGDYELRPAPEVGAYRILAPHTFGNVALWVTGPGESETANRAPYSLVTGRGVYTYTFTTTPYGEFRHNDFGYGTGEVRGGVYNLISGAPIPGAPITLTVAIRTADYCEWATGWITRTLTGTDGQFRFDLRDQAGWWPFPKCVRLSFPATIEIAAGRVITHASHTAGNPPGAVWVTTTDIEFAGGQAINWVDNNAYYYGLRPDIIREHPVVPVNPDLLVPLITPLRQAVTTTCEYLDSDGTWRPLEAGVQEVYLTMTIRTAPPQRYFYPACADGAPTCTLVLCVTQGMSPQCVGARPLGGRYTFFASEYVAHPPALPTLPYRLFAVTPGHYSVQARWLLFWTGADGNPYSADITTDAREWDVVGAVFRRRE